ncbi:TetR/AcrR family transcriptional regulator C-terminal domain-containing protein [Thalassiella azotivora]
MPSQPAGTRTRLRVQAPARLSLETVVDAAIELLDAEGLGAVTTRRVAERLDTGQASLYAHVRNKDDLLARVLEKVVADIPLPTARGTWQQRLLRYGRQTRKGLLAHPGLSSVALASPPSGRGWVRRVEWLTTLLRGAGLPDRVVVGVVDHVHLVVVASAHEEELSARGDGSAAQGHWARRVGVDDDVPGEDFPHAAEVAPLALSSSAADRFDRGLRLLVDGLEQQLTTEG